MIKDISSTKNEKYKFIKALKTKKERIKNQMFTVEGIKSVQDAIDAGSDIVMLAVSDKLTEKFDFNEIYRIPDEIFSGLCDTETPQGVIAVLRMPRKKKISLDDSLYLYCDRVSDPGNIGTIIRICDAVDCKLLLSPGCADIYNPKTVRASMGSFFHTEITENVSYTELFDAAKNGYKIISGTLSDKTVDYNAPIYDGKKIIVVGNEANGICGEITSKSDFCVKIPIFGRAESLNVAVAAALILYKAKEEK